MSIGWGREESMKILFEESGGTFRRGLNMRPGRSHSRILREQGQSGRERWKFIIVLRHCGSDMLRWK